MSDITDDILSRVQHRQPGPATWFTRLPVEIQEELDALKARWQAGQIAIQKRSLARAIIDTLRERDIPVSGIQGVEDWLRGGRHH